MPDIFERDGLYLFLKINFIDKVAYNKFKYDLHLYLYNHMIVRS